ncbi:monooxygenase, FAD-binding [Caballeronia calidae]|uniref:Monooxygenase, FAD-binding n=1 Tax=Caballeronia calidae TaxID=1777139 RepID=A0A158EC89_9BURK|nr:FAD binding domain-containing protein [Caballeronia calidae]SAL04458.1 monooxygenase, FAD-binding [Caballeronia calidae]
METNESSVKEIREPQLATDTGAVPHILLPASRQPKAIVIGGSLGGLFAANALRAIGWDVEVYERSPSPLDSRGGGIVLQGAVLQAFRFSGVPATGHLGVRSNDRIYLDRDGTVSSRQYMPQTQTSWNKLYGVLRQNFPDEQYHRGAKLVAIEQDSHGVTAIFADGSTAHGDLLIGADGGNSTVRELMLPKISPRYAGYTVWRGLVDESRLSPSMVPHLYENFVFQQDRGALMLQYMVPGQDGSTEIGRRRYNWLWYLKSAAGDDLDAVLTDKTGKRRTHSVPPGELSPAQETWFRTMAATHANPEFRALIENTDDIFVQVIQDLEVPRMVFDRVVLMGDAAFIPRPHTAGSTAQAATNAITLADTLRGQRDMTASLADWQEGQVSEGLAITEWGQRMGNRIMNIA